MDYVGHPLVDRASAAPSKAAARAALGLDSPLPPAPGQPLTPPRTPPVTQLVVALLAASRPQELRHVWPVVAEAALKLQADADARGHPLRFILPVAAEGLRPQVWPAASL